MDIDTRSPSEQITAAVTAWPGVSAGPGSRGEYGFRVAGREIGHLHGDHAAHFAFSKELWHELHDAGRIDYHPVFPGKAGMGARRIQGPADVDDVIALLRLNYDRAVADRGLPRSA
jgi:luciferase-like monooxygenase